MAWQKLTITDLKKILSDDEVNLLNSTSTESLSAVNDLIEIVSNTWRGAIAGKGMKYDVRDGYVPGAYTYYILVHARYALWTKFPNSPDIALDEARKKEYETALEMLSKMSIAVEDPDWENSSENPENGMTQLGSVKIPFFTRMDRELAWNWPQISADYGN